MEFCNNLLCFSTNIEALTDFSKHEWNIKRGSLHYNKGSNKIQPKMKTKTILSSESLQVFVTGLAGFNEKELTKTKELYLRNAVSEFRAAKKQFEAVHWIAFVCLFFPPLFFFGFVFRKGSKIEFEEASTRLFNALNMWKEDLPHCYEELKAEIEEVTTWKSLMDIYKFW